MVSLFDAVKAENGEGGSGKTDYRYLKQDLEFVGGQGRFEMRISGAFDGRHTWQAP
jgi:hypothetical protein